MGVEAGRGIGRGVAVPLDRQPAEVAVEQVRGDVLDAPGRADGRAVPVLGRERAQQVEEVPVQLPEQLRDEDRFGWLMVISGSESCLPRYYDPPLGSPTSLGRVRINPYAGS